MFGIGFGELMIIGVVLIVAVGPDRMPTFMKAVGRGLREFRRATRELRNAVGIDQLLADEDLRDLRKGIDLNATDAARPASPGERRNQLTAEEALAEEPLEGVDIRHARAIENAKVEAEARAVASTSGHAAGHEEDSST